jgi:hypothetical protein
VKPNALVILVALALFGSMAGFVALDFNGLEKGRTFFGLTKLNLNNNAMDPSQIREALAYYILRNGEVPAGRTAFARVFITVPGQYDKAYAGLYTIVEQVDERFLKARFVGQPGQPAPDMSAKFPNPVALFPRLAEDTAVVLFIPADGIEPVSSALGAVIAQGLAADEVVRELFHKLGRERVERSRILPLGEAKTLQRTGHPGLVHQRLIARERLHGSQEVRRRDGHQKRVG